tara:strand:- start:1766 stop:2245 length:480 start_codon:yes stop_codon:yes gene_type:complete
MKGMKVYNNSIFNSQVSYRIQLQKTNLQTSDFPLLDLHMNKVFPSASSTRRVPIARQFYPVKPLELGEEEYDEEEEEEELERGTQASNDLPHVSTEGPSTSSSSSTIRSVRVPRMRPHTPSVPQAKFGIVSGGYRNLILYQKLSKELSYCSTKMYFIQI